MKIFTEKEVKRGQKRRKVVGWEKVMKEDELPFEYTQSMPYFYQGSDDHIHIFIKQHYYVCLMKERTYEEKYFQEILSHMQRAGDRLHELREEEKELKKRWTGKETFVL